MSDLMKKKHQLRLIELEESVLLAQVNNNRMNLIVKEIIGFSFYFVFIVIIHLSYVSIEKDTFIKCHNECLSVR